MKFIHFTDTHLGKNETKLEEREQDFYRAFEQVIDAALSEKVDFIVHSGDVLDRARPPTRTLIFLVKQLARLKEAGIPFYVVPGSHDIGVDGTLLSVLDAIGLLVNLASKRYTKTEGENIILSGEHCGDAFLCGVAGRRDNITDIYSRLRIKDRGKFNIFVFHHITSEIADKFADIPSSLLPPGFQYYAAGHWHGFAKLRHGDGHLIYPGATEYNELTEMVNEPKRYFMLVNVHGNQADVQERPISTRPIVYKEVNCDGFDAHDMAEEALKVIPGEGDSAVLIIRFTGKLGKGTKSEIDRNKIHEFAVSNGYLYTKIYVGDVYNPDTPHVSTKARSALEIEREYLKKQNYGPKEIAIAERLIRLLGQKLAASELDTVNDDASEMIRSELIENKENTS
jgi:DNA repair exonuclease SbcCD nuclease subunit